MLLTKRFFLENKVGGKCVDYVNIHDGPTSAAVTLNSEPLCGEHQLGQYETSGPAVTIHLVTDATATYRGFDIVYSSFCE